MSVTIRIDHAQKRYGDNIIIRDLSLNIREGEFFTLLGPSGCGKTTLLRMIAGFNSIENGDFYFNDVRINDMDPSRRRIGMVFQNYAIFPHLNVRDNVMFGLKHQQQKMTKDEMRSRAEKFMDLMHINEYADRKPERLSGGQQQRVALARALVIQPDVLLMDEPLSNLDAKLRVEMRETIRSIQREVGITTVYVTHDQEEAMAVSDRIAVMNLGEIQQIGTPQAIYQRPANLFVANFIGRTNILKGHLQQANGTPMLRLADDWELPVTNLRPEEAYDRDVMVSVRPEEFVISDDDQGMEATVDTGVFLGLNMHYFMTMKTGEQIQIVSEATLDQPLKDGARVKLRMKRAKINVLSADGSANLMTGVVNDAIPAKEGRA